MSLTKDETYFLLRRLHSLTGIVPIGGFLLFHFFENASARLGPAAFNETVLEIGKMPYVYLLELCVLILPILFHGIFGLFITAPAQPNVVHYPYARNFAYLAQRVTGVIAFIYIFYHVITTRAWALFVKGSPITFSDMHAKLSNPWALGLYVVGILAATFHFSNGLWSFSITWGLVRSRSGQRLLALGSMLLFVVLALVGLDIVSAFVLGQSLSSLVGAKILAALI